MMHRALQVVEQLAQEGISAEVIDPRSLVPFDWDLVKASVMKTTRAVIVEEGPRQGGWAAEIAATLAETMSDYLTAPVTRAVSPDILVPFSPPMENFYRPDAERITAAARKLVRPRSVAWYATDDDLFPNDRVQATPRSEDQFTARRRNRPFGGRENSRVVFGRAIVGRHEGDQD
jgi:hypothetical protein